MKRMHIHVGVDNLDQAIPFYSALFGVAPTKIKVDYAKWMLDDPCINFAISTRSGRAGLDHLGIQVSEEHELDVLRDRLKKADLSMFDEGETVCCYAESEKSWIQDPAGIAWEAYRTMQETRYFSSSGAAGEGVASAPQRDAAIPVGAGTSSGGCCG